MERSRLLSPENQNEKAIPHRIISQHLPELVQSAPSSPDSATPRTPSDFGPTIRVQGVSGEEIAPIYDSGRRTVPGAYPLDLDTPTRFSFDRDWKCLPHCTCELRILLNRLEFSIPSDLFPDLSALQTRFQIRFESDAVLEATKLLKGSDAKLFVNVLYSLSKHFDHHPEFLDLCQSWIRKIARNSGVLPAAYAVLEPITVDEYPFTGGGFADVHKGNMGGKPVAVKVIRLYIDQLDTDALRGACCIEALSWTNLSQNRRIIPFIGVSETLFKGTLSFISPWYFNGNIRDFLRKNPDRDREFYVTEVSKGLEFLHSKQHVHGDLKAVNVLIDDDGGIRLGDMGLTTVSLSRRFNSTKRDGSSGSSRWMSPELLVENQEPSYRSDIYALGMTGYEILCGEYPYPNLKEHSVIVAKMSNTLPDRHLAISDDLWNILLQCWKRDPTSRPSATRLVEMLEALQPYKFDKRSPISPFSPHVVFWDQKEYPTAYHLWESMKYERKNAELARRIRKAKRYRDVQKILEDSKPQLERWKDGGWSDSLKMKEVMRLKFVQHPELRKELLATGERKLIFLSKTDRNWGADENSNGENKLGKYLQEIRTSLATGH